MPYIILTANGDELDRHDLKGPLSIGRSPECNVAVHDILMSRRHCQIEQVKGRWRIVDCGSKNGTHFSWKPIEEHILFDGDSIRMGRTYLEFRSGPFVPGVASPRKTKLVRPADPHEALTGTISDFVLLESDGDDTEFDGVPSPRNRPVTAHEKKATASILEELSSSWDSIVATASRPSPRLRNMPRPMPVAIERGRRKRPEPDLSLQATPQHLPFLEMMPQAAKKKRKRSTLPIVVAAIGIAMATLVVLFSGWVMMQG